MGYDSCGKGYKVYTLHTKKIVLSWDVIFNEDKSWNWKKNHVEFVLMFFPLKDSEIRG